MRELLTRVPTTAMDIAACVRSNIPITQAAALIEQYALAVAAAAKIEATTEVYNRLQARMQLSMETPLVPHA